MIHKEGSLDFVRAGFEKYLCKYEDVLKVELEQLYLVNGMKEVMDIVGESGLPNKLSGHVYYEISLGEKDCLEVRDYRVISKGELKIYESFPERNSEGKFEREYENGEYIEALRGMEEKLREYRHKAGYSIRILLWKEDGVPVLSIAMALHVHDSRCGADLCREKGVTVTDIREAAEIRGCTPYEGWESYRLGDNYILNVGGKYKLTYQKYKEEPQTETVEGTYVQLYLFLERAEQLYKEIKEHNLMVESYDKFGMDMKRMDMLAGYIAMEYYMGYDAGFEVDESQVAVYKKREETYYDALHRQENIEEYCSALHAFFPYLAKEKIVTVYEALRANPDGKLLDIFHTVFPSRYKVKYQEGISEEYPEKIKNRLYYMDEKADQTHLYKENQIYLAMVFDAKWGKNSDGTYDGYVVLLSEEMQMRLGTETLERKEKLIGPRKREVQIPELNEVHEKMKTETEWDKTYPGAILKNITYYKAGTETTYARAWAGGLAPVRIAKKSIPGYLIVEYCEPEEHSPLQYIKDRSGE